MSEVTFDIERKENCKVIFTVRADKELVGATHQKGIKKVAKNISVPGFRKGKAPTDMIVKKFSHAVNEEWHKELANKAFALAQEKAHVPLLNNDSRIVFDMKSCDLNEGAEMTFSFETEPTIPDVTPEKIKLETPKRAPVGKKEVDETIDRIRTFFGKWDYITDRPAKLGDHVRIDVDLTESDKPARVIANQRFELKKGGIAKWMEDLVIGMKVGEQREGVSKPDDDASDAEKKKFEPKKVAVFLNAIEVCTLPECDDEFALKVGVETMDKMRERIEKLLNKQADEYVQRELRNQVSEYLSKEVTFDLPESLVEEEYTHRLRARKENAQFRTEYNALTGDAKKAKEDEIREESAQAIRLFYLCRKIAGQNNIKVSPADLNQDVEIPLDAMFADPQMMEAANDPKRQAAAMSRVLLNKAQDFLIGQAEKVPEVKKAAPKKPATKQAKK